MVEKLLAFEGIEERFQERFFNDTFTHMEIVPKTKEEAKKLDELKSKLVNVIQHSIETLGNTQIEIFRVKDFVELESGELLHLGKHKLIIFIRKVNKKGELELSRVGVKTVNESYTLIPHSEIIEEVERLIRKAGYTPKTYIKNAGVTFRSLTVTDKEVKVDSEKFKIGFLINNSYNYTSAVRIHLYLLKSEEGYVLPLVRDILYKKHRENEITQEDFDNSLDYAQKVIEALPYLKKITVSTREVLRGIAKVKTTYWKKTKDGKREHRTVYVGRTIAVEVIKRVGMRASVFDIWKAISEVVFSKDTHLSGLNIQTKRRIENEIFKILESFLKQIKTLSLSL